jgi:membrane-bound metal-dependent hydrolase YbcI (DUF457 family)
MASPVGHGIIGLALARRFGIKSRIGLAAAALAASLPDADIIAGAIFHGDPWKLHRKGTHTLNFTLTAGALAGLAGLLAAESVDGERDLLLDALAGAVIIGSHIPLDRVPIPTLSRGPSLLGMSLGNWIVDAAIWSGLAWAIWPRSVEPDAAGATPSPMTS